MDRSTLNITMVPSFNDVTLHVTLTITLNAHPEQADRDRDGRLNTAERKDAEVPFALKPRIE